MASVSLEILQALGKVVENIHTVLSRAGSVAIKSDLQKCNFSNPSALDLIFNKWDDIIKLLDELSVTLNRGNIDDIIKITKNLTRCVTDIQYILVTSAAEIGSFVPGPIGMVCSLVLAVGRFAVGDILGGFLNLLGVIPGAKLAKFIPCKSVILPILELKKLLRNRFGYSMSELSRKAAISSEKFECVKTLNNYLSEALSKAKDNLNRADKNFFITKDRLLTQMDDGWNKAREELIAEQTFEYMLNSIFKMSK